MTVRPVLNMWHTHINTMGQDGTGCASIIYSRFFHSSRDQFAYFKSHSMVCWINSFQSSFFFLLPIDISTSKAPRVILIERLKSMLRWVFFFRSWFFFSFNFMWSQFVLIRLLMSSSNGRKKFSLKCSAWVNL